MIVKNIEYSRKFIKEFRILPEVIKKRAIKTEEIFKKNPLHPSLRLHQLHGKLKKYWSISITLDYRIIFKRMDDSNIIFGSIGKHEIYEK